jgi:hypothetical protein
MMPTGIETEIQGVTLQDYTHAHAVSCGITAKLTLPMIMIQICTVRTI